MGLFGKLFEKKECSICGGEIGLLGNRKLEDGNCCKNCAKKLSPWFEERRHSTVEQINEQLAYREENQNKLAGFRVSQIIGDYYKLYVEEANGVPTRFFVTTADDYMDANPDIIEFKDLMSCTTDIRTNENELKKDDGNGNQVSYNPPRFETDYDFYINMTIANNPYFDDIRFKLNGSTVTLETRAGGGVSFLGMNLTTAPVDVSNPRDQERYQNYMGMCQQIEYIVKRSRGEVSTAAAMPAQQPTPTVSPVTAPAAAPVTANVVAPAADAWTCTSCGTENEGKFCQGCGAPKPVSWTCFCGTVNSSKFCQNCGTKQFSLDDIECSECSWTVATNDEDPVYTTPSHCPNCDKKFNSDDIA